MESEEVIRAFFLLLLRATIIFLPALTANSAPLVLRNLLKNHKFRPVDGGRVLRDGRRVFGENKSWEGVVAGTATGFLVGLVYSWFLNTAVWIAYGLLMGVGAMVGDLLNSFIKRRLRIESGEPFMPLDQLTFLYTAYLFVLPLNLIDEFIKTYDVLSATCLVLFLHPLTNLIAYWLGLKKNPW